MPNQRFPRSLHEESVRQCRELRVLIRFSLRSPSTWLTEGCRQLVRSAIECAEGEPPEVRDVVKESTRTAVLPWMLRASP